jgi:prevent-host-death family protein
MPAFNVHEAKANFSKLLDRVLEGDQVLITRNGVPVPELVPARNHPFPIGAGRHDPNINPEALTSDEWWQPMTDSWGRKLSQRVYAGVGIVSERRNRG